MYVYLQGGFGNQLFEYAFGRSLALKKDTKVFFDKSRIESCSVYWGNPSKNVPIQKVLDVFLHYGLGVYDIEVNFAEPNGGPVYKEKGGFDPEVFSAPTNTVFDGVWWCEKYFNAEVIRHELSKPKGEPDEDTKRVADEIASTKNSAFVSVRRGELIYFNHCLTLEYYQLGMRYIEEHYPETKFFIFSDDREWCRENFFAKNCTVIGHSRLNDSWRLGTVHWDLWLMNMCKNAVLANSSFSWWGAWINPNKEIVIVPKTSRESDMYPEKWVKI